MGWNYFKKISRIWSLIKFKGGEAAVGSRMIISFPVAIDPDGDGGAASSKMSSLHCFPFSLGSAALLITQES